MNQNPSLRERQIGWRLTQIVILAFTTILVLSLTDNNNDHSQVLTDVPLLTSEEKPELLTSSTEPPEISVTPSQQPKDLRKFTLIATGELLIHELVAEAASSYANTGFNFLPMFEKVKPIIKGADLALCHLETPLSFDNSVLKYYPVFQVPYELADAIADTGYQGCSIASNHLLDNGIKGLESTLNHLNAAGVMASGASLSGTDTGSSRFTPKGISVAHLSYTNLMNGASLPLDPPWIANHLEVSRVIEDADAAVKNGAEFVVVSVHWGNEYLSDISAEQEDIAIQLLSSKNIDLLIGHGAHVIQPVLKVGNKYAVVGMGNFLSNQPGDERVRCSRCPPETQDGMIAWFSISDFPDGSIRVVDAGYVPTWVDRSNYEIIPIGVEKPDLVNVGNLESSVGRTSNVLEPGFRRLTFKE